MLTLWNLLLSLLWPLLYLYRPFRGTITRRLGKFELQRYEPQRRGLKVLVNAVSAGEVVAITPFILELRRARPDAQVALLTTTDSGQEMAAGKLGDNVELVAYFPLVDLPFVVRRYLDRLLPDLYITTEAELWPNMQSQCRARGITVALINARLYMHNKRGWRGALVRRLLALVDLIVCQDERQRANFLKFGVPPERLAVSGNIKFDFALPDWSAEQLAEWKRKLGIGAGPVIVAGSTHPGEEDLIIGSAVVGSVAVSGRTGVRRGTPSLSGAEARTPPLIIAPRHIERAAEVLALCQASGLRAASMGEAEAGAPWDVLVIDRYGVLVDCYRAADVVVLGGTFHPKVGGHNILEATALGKPVIVGPYVYSIAAQVELLEAVGGIVRVADGAALGQALTALLQASQHAIGIGSAAKAATEENKGAAARAVEAVLRLAG